jgi:hypothetical protein
MISFTVDRRPGHRSQRAYQLLRESINRELDLAEARGCEVVLSIENQLHDDYLADGRIDMSVVGRIITIYIQGELHLNHSNGDKNADQGVFPDNSLNDGKGNAITGPEVRALPALQDLPKPEDGADGQR